MHDLVPQEKSLKKSSSKQCLGKRTSCQLFIMGVDLLFFRVVLQTVAQEMIQR